VKQNTVHHLRVVNGSTNLLDEANVAKVNVLGRSANEAKDRVDGDGRKDGRVLRNDLGGETGRGGAKEVVSVGKVDGGRHLLEVLDDLLGSAGEGLGDDGGVDTLAEKLLSGTEKGTGEDDNGGGSVSGLDVLSC
jgi:hypothetical protein